MLHQISYSSQLKTNRESIRSFTHEMHLSFKPTHQSQLSELIQPSIHSPTSPGNHPSVDTFIQPSFHQPTHPAMIHPSIWAPILPQDERSWSSSKQLSTRQIIPWTGSRLSMGEHRGTNYTTKFDSSGNPITLIVREYNKIEDLICSCPKKMFN